MAALKELESGPTHYRFVKKLSISIFLYFSSKITIDYVIWHLAFRLSMLLALSLPPDVWVDSGISAR